MRTISFMGSRSEGGTGFDYCREVLISKYIQIKVFPWWYERPKEMVDKDRPDGYAVSVVNLKLGENTKAEIYNQKFYTDLKGHTKPLNLDEALALAKSIQCNPYKYLEIIVLSKGAK